jgi:flagellar biosynthesis protein FliR
MPNLLSNFLLSLTLVFFLTLIRVSAMLLVMPIFGSPNLPIKIRVALAVMFSMILVPIVGRQNISYDISTGLFFFYAGREVIVGLLIGFGSMILFEAVKLGGELVGRNMGFGMARVIDPSTNQQVSAISTLQSILILMIFLAVNGHHWLIFAMGKSFEIIPLAGANFGSQIPDKLTEMVGNVFPTAVKFVAPAMAILLIIQISLAITSRAAPQMSIMIVAMPLKIGVGLIGLVLSLPMFYQLFLKLFNTMQQDVGFLIKSMQ